MTFPTFIDYYSRRLKAHVVTLTSTNHHYNRQTKSFDVFLHKLILYMRQIDT